MMSCVCYNLIFMASRKQSSTIEVPVHLSLTANVNGKNKTLYMSTVKSIEERTRSNLTLSLTELGLLDGQELMVADQTNPNTITIKLNFAVQKMEME